MVGRLGVHGPHIAIDFVSNETGSQHQRPKSPPQLPGKFRSRHGSRLLDSIWLDSSPSPCPAPRLLEQLIDCRLRHLLLHIKVAVLGPPPRITVMALVLASNPPLKPDIELAQAIDDYEKILSVEERNQLHAQGAPDAMAAINLTTIIDRECNRHRRHGIGPRLITFLESVQQLSGVVDTFISSHPEFAALVWGGVKLTLLVI